MRTVSLTIAASTLAAATAFQSTPISSQTARRVNTELYAYVPSGFTKESWAAFQKKETAKKQTKNLGGVGPRGFKSRSFQSFQEALERGEATHLLPVENAAARIKSGELKPEDIPYMQRGGEWDNRDIKGAKKVRWLKSDEEYASGGFKKSQSISILGEGAGLDWTGRRDKMGPSGPVSGVKLGKNYKAPNVAQLKGKAAANAKPEKKKMFGLF